MAKTCSHVTVYDLNCCQPAAAINVTIHCKHITESPDLRIKGRPTKSLYHDDTRPASNFCLLQQTTTHLVKARHKIAVSLQSPAAQGTYTSSNAMLRPLRTKGVGHIATGGHWLSGGARAPHWSANISPGMRSMESGSRAPSIFTCTA